MTQSIHRDKYLIRFDGPTLRAEIHAAATQDHVTMNTWLNLAIDEKLGRGKRLDYVLDLADKALKKAAK
jgi:hypothetical protein